MQPNLVELNKLIVFRMRQMFLTVWGGDLRQAVVNLKNEANQYHEMVQDKRLKELRESIEQVNASFKSHPKGNDWMQKYCLTVLNTLRLESVQWTDSFSLFYSVMIFIGNSA